MTCTRVKCGHGQAGIVPAMADQHPTGPRAGATTRTKSELNRVVLYRREHDVKTLKKRAYEEGETWSAIARQVSRPCLDVED